MDERVILDPTEPSRTNLALNPSTELGTNLLGLAKSEWAEGNLVQTATPGAAGFPPALGNYCARITGKKDNTAALRTLSLSQSSSVGSVTPGLPYSLSVFIYVTDSLALGWWARIDWYTAASAYIGSSVNSAKYTSLGTQRLEIANQIAPAEASFATLVVLGQSTTATDTTGIYIDGWQFEQGAGVTAYIDGDTVPIVPTYTVAWNGTPHASTSTLTSTRTELDITPWVRVEGIDWGDAEMEAYKAQAEIGESVLDYRLPNRQITAPLVIKEAGGTSFATARSYLQAKAALFMREGGTGKRITKTGGTVYFDIPANGLTLGGDWLAANRGVDTNAELRLEALPDFYEAEELVAEAEEKSATELVKVIADPGGDMPARVRLVVEERQGADQKSLIWAFRSRYYTAATTARSFYEAEELAPLGEATKGALSGASGGTAVSHTALPAVWTPVLGSNIGGSIYLTHEGAYRVFARLRSPQGTAVSARLVWDVGDLVNPTENEAWTFPGGSAFYLADLGEVRLNRAPIGAHRWQGQIQAKGTEGGEDVNVDRVWIFNTDERMGILSAPPQVGSTNETIVAWDNFNATSSGTITGKAAPLGGTWAGAGDAVGFSVDTTNKWIVREEISDADLNTGRYERLGTGAATKIDMSVDIYLYKGGDVKATVRQGLFVRYTNTSNWLMACYDNIGTDNKVRDRWTLRLFKRVSGTITQIGEYTPILDNRWKTMRITVSDSGAVAVYSGSQGGVPALGISLTDADLAAGSGKSVESGGFGIYDANSMAAALTRKYDNVYVTAPVSTQPTADAVLFASQKGQLTTQGMYRLDVGGSAYGPVSRVIGDLPRLPAGGLEGRSTELMIKASRGDLEELPDSAIDDLAVKVYASRTWLTVPGTL